MAGIFLSIGALCWFWYVDRFPSWDEEVLLSDGRSIIVHRKQEYIEGYGVKRTWLTFSLPEIGGEKTWYEWMYPAIVDVHEGKVYVVGYTPSVQQFSSYSNPRYLLVAYSWQGSGLQRIPLMSVPAAVRKNWNMLPCSSRGENTTWRAKTAGWCGEDGKYKVGTPRLLDLGTLEKGAKHLAGLQGNSELFSD